VDEFAGNPTLISGGDQLIQNGFEIQITFVDRIAIRADKQPRADFVHVI
jgi:hypothetical protein